MKKRFPGNECKERCTCLPYQWLLSLKNKKIIYLFFSVLGLRCRSGFSLVVESGGYSVVVACGPLIVVASLVVEHGIQVIWASAVVTPRLQSTGSIVVAHGHSCSIACGIFFPILLHWQADSLPLSQQGSPGIMQGFVLRVTKEANYLEIQSEIFVGISKNNQGQVKGRILNEGQIFSSAGRSLHNQNA